MRVPSNSCPRQVCCGSALRGFERQSLWKHSLWLLRTVCHQCATNSFRCRERDSSSVLVACGMKHRLAFSASTRNHRARELDPISCSSTLSACSEVALWSRTLDLLWGNLASNSCEADSVCYNAAMASCSGRWVQAVSLLNCRNSGLQCTPISFNTSISSCADCLQWSWALFLLDDLSRATLPQDVLSLEAVVDACRSREQFFLIPSLLRRLKWSP